MECREIGIFTWTKFANFYKRNEENKKSVLRSIKTKSRKEGIRNGQHYWKLEWKRGNAEKRVYTLYFYFLLYKQLKLVNLEDMIPSS